jgi:hypothetical protein
MSDEEQREFFVASCEHLVVTGEESLGDLLARLYRLAPPG